MLENTTANGSGTAANRDHNKTNGSNQIPKLIIPDSKIGQHEKTAETKPLKKKRRDKSDLGDNFVAPDGGWGWVVSIAGGVNFLVTVAMAQQFGIVFRDHMAQLGISSSELTTIINIQIALSAITGLVNGPLFRRYSFRQVALVGSILTFIGLFACVFANSFLLYCLSYSLFYGFGRGLSISASSLAVYTYFKEKRRTATSYQYGVASFGPIVLPFLATYLLDYIGVEGTILFFAGLSLNTVACALVYQPVKWHVKKQSKDVEASKNVTTSEDAHPVETELPVIPHDNDCYYISKTSLNTPSVKNRLNTWDKQQQCSDEQMVELKCLNSKENINNNNDFQQLRNKEKQQALDDEEKELRKKLPWYKKVVIIFDLDLLRDFTYLNLSMGLTLINFVELNFGILTPFILDEFGFEKHQIALAMSLLGVCDLVIRFLVPLITARINLSNQAFFSVGILGMCIGRFFMSITRNFYVMIGIFLWLGLNKALRTVFWSLILPSYVPLKRLPAASGLQLLMSGLFSLACGPLVGLIRDYTNYAFTLNFLNVLCLLAIGGWTLESVVRKYKNIPNTGLN